MRIGEVASAAGVSPRALRYYEEQGLLASVRSPSGQRHYAEDAVERVRWIQRLYAAGVPSSAIVDLLPCVHTGVATEAMVERLAEQLRRLDAQIAELTATRTRLAAVVGAAEAYASAGVPVGACDDDAETAAS